jgi:hypothetical protein
MQLDSNHCYQHGKILLPKYEKNSLNVFISSNMSLKSIQIKKSQRASGITKHN